MTDHADATCFVGIDWATTEHAVCVVEPSGAVRAERMVKHTGTGLADLADWLAKQGGGDPSAVWIAIEVPHGAVVDTLLERGFRVHACNPKQLDRFRDRFTVAGAKDDSRDAQVLADSLRTDRRAFRALVMDAPPVIELREWSRLAGDLTEERTRLVNRLREQVRRYFPQALELAPDPGAEWFLALLQVVPTPAAARGTPPQAVATVLKAHHIRRLTARGVLQALRQPPLVVAPGTTEAATAHLRLLTERLRVVNRQLGECRRELDQRCDALTTIPDPAQGEGQADEQRDVEILRSLPGLGRIILAALLAEAARLLAARDYHALRALGGVAPVTRASGKRSKGRAPVQMRRACSRALRNALYHWARVAAQVDPHWKARYAALRARGHSHGRACRGIADRLLKVAIAMLKSQTLYDPARWAA